MKKGKYLNKNMTKYNFTVNGFLSQDAVFITNKKHKEFNYSNEPQIFNFNADFKHEIKDIKGFKRFLRFKKVDKFEEGEFTVLKDDNKLIFCGESKFINSKIEINGITYNYLVKGDLNYIKGFFKLFKEITSLIIYYSEDYPICFKINSEEFVLAPISE